MRDVRYILKEARELWAFRESERLTHMLVKMDGSVIPFYLVKARSIYHSHHKGPKSEKVSIIRVTHHKGKPIASPHSDFPAPDMHSSFRWSMIIMVNLFPSRKPWHLWKAFHHQFLHCFLPYFASKVRRTKMEENIEIEKLKTQLRQFDWFSNTAMVPPSIF